MSTRTDHALNRVAAQRDLADTLDGGPGAAAPWSAPGQTAPGQDVPRLVETPGSPHRGRLVLVAALTAGVALGGAALVATHAPAPSVAPTLQSPTTTPAATTALDRLAAAAAAQPAPNPALPYAYGRTVSWDTASDSFDGGPVTNVHTVRSDRETWSGDDGAGRILSTSSDPTGGTDETTTPTGGSVAGTAFFRPAPADGDVEAQLRAEFPTRTGAQWLTGTSDLWGTTADTPATRAALLRILDGRTDVSVGGMTLDRAGRTGIAVSAIERSLPGGPSRTTVLLDPATGTLLAEQHARLQPDGTTFAVDGYTLHLVSGRVGDTTTTVPLPEPATTGPAAPLTCATGTASPFAAPAADAPGDVLPQEAADDAVAEHTADGPAFAWRTVAVPSADARTLANGTVQLDVTRGADGTWRVTGGTRCG